MKKITTILIILCSFSIVYAQVPTGFNYQAMVRNAEGEILSDSEVSIRISLIKENETGELVYSEIHRTQTNKFGLINLIIGDGEFPSGTFSPTGWGLNSHFIKVEIDPNGGDAFEYMGTSRLLSVPYAFHAQTVENDAVDDADPDPLNELQTISISGTLLTLSHDGGTVTLPTTGEGGDNWGTQTVITDGSLYGEGTPADPLGVDGDLTDDQTLSIDGYELSISNGNSITLPASGNGTITSVEAGTGLNGGGTNGNVTLNVDVPLILSGTGDEIIKGIHANGNVGAFGTPDYGTYGQHASGNSGKLGTLNEGVKGEHASGNWGQLGSVQDGAYGEHANGHWGQLGKGDAGVYGANANGHFGSLGSLDYGVYGRVTGNWGAIGTVSEGIKGENINGNWGVIGTLEEGVKGQHTSGNWGQLGTINEGVRAKNANGNQGILGGVWTAVGGWDASGNYGTIGTVDYGVYGEYISGNWGTIGTEDEGVRGENANGNSGKLGTLYEGVKGEHASGNWGQLGTLNEGVKGEHASGNYGALGTNSSGVVGSDPSGNSGVLATAYYGVRGIHYALDNVGTLGSGVGGVHGWSGISGNWGTIGTETEGVSGVNNTSGNWGLLGTEDEGVRGENANGIFGLLGTANYGLFAKHTGGNWGMIGDHIRAAYFGGNVHVAGILSKDAGAFRIDHPLDPANKYLQHSFVESPDMMNIYNGNVILDEKGAARIILPDWFTPLNKEFRYQLTCIGGYANVYIEEEIENGQFKIGGGREGLKVSWQVTGIRKDAVALMNPIVVELPKEGSEAGKYLHPEAFGQPEELGIEYEMLHGIEEIANEKKGVK